MTSDLPDLRGFSWLRRNKFDTVVREQEETLIDPFVKNVAITLRGLIELSKYQMGVCQEGQNN